MLLGRPTCSMQCLKIDKVDKFNDKDLEDTAQCSSIESTSSMTTRFFRCLLERQNIYRSRKNVSRRHPLRQV